MKRSAFSLVVVLVLAACTTSFQQPIPVIPGPPPPASDEVAEPSVTPPSPGVETATAPSSSAMASACRDAAASQFGLARDSLAVSPAEDTALGFVAFGQSPNGSFECSFGPDGGLRAVRQG